MSEKRLKAFMHGLNSLRSIATKVGLFLAVGSPNANNRGFVHLTEMLILGVKWMRLGENHINSCSPPSAKAQNMTPRIESCDLTLTFAERNRDHFATSAKNSYFTNSDLDKSTTAPRCGKSGDLYLTGVYVIGVLLGVHLTGMHLMGDTLHRHAPDRHAPHRHMSYRRASYGRVSYGHILHGHASHRRISHGHMLSAEERKVD